MKRLTSTRPIVYEQLSKLGEGTFSTVYKALRRDSEFDIQQHVALKILKSQIAIENWRGEFEALEKVNSDKCVRVIGWDVLDEKPTLVLEWVDGLTLNTLVRQTEVRQQLIDELSLQIYEGLQDIHRSGVIHGDLSLQNVMITRNGKIKLLDFGLSKAKTKMFTPEFAAPELLNGETATIASDLYSLGRLREFLERRAKLPLSFTTKQLLKVNPDERHFDLLFNPNESERFAYQSDISLLVQSPSPFKPHIEAPQTRMHGGVSTFFRNILLLLLTTAALGSASATHDIRDGVLVVRTEKWYSIAVDGQKAGYSPLEMNLKPNSSHTVEWQSANSHGQRTLTLKPGQNMVITDTFFN